MQPRLTRRSFLVVSSAAAAQFIEGCGGGGGGSSVTPAPPRTHTLSVSPSAPLDHVIAGLDVRVQADQGLFTVPGDLVITEYQTTWPERPASSQVTTDRLLDFNAVVPIGSGMMTVTFPAHSLTAKRWLGMMQEDNGVWASLKTVVTPTSAIVTTPSLPVVSRAFGKRLLRLGLGAVPYQANFTEYKAGLILLAGTGPPTSVPNTGEVAVVVHGMNSGIEKLQYLAKQLVTQRVFDTVYGFAYPWAMPIEQSGAALALILKEQPPEQLVQLIGHSMGGLVSRATLEQDFQGADRACFHVQHLLTCGTPHNGSQLAGAALDQQLESESLNDPEDSLENWEQLGRLSDLDTRSTRQLAPGSSFLTGLNTRPPNRLNSVPYALIAGSKDLLVDPLSAQYLPNDATLGRQSAGSLGLYGHSELVTDPAAVIKLIDLIRNERAQEGPQLTHNLANNGRAGDDGWHFTLMLDNKTKIDTTLTVTTLILKASNRDGAEFTRQWYDVSTGSGQWLPFNRQSINLVIPHLGQQALDLHTWFDFERSLYNQAKVDRNKTTKTVDIYAHGHDGLGRPFSQHVRFALLDQDGSGPSTPRRPVGEPRLVPGGVFAFGRP